MPGCTQATPLSRSISSSLFIRVMASTTGRPSGAAPPASPVPAPRGATARPWRAATFTQATTSEVDSGKHTGPALPSR